MAKFTDDLDRAIVRLLEEDGRLANLEIARRLGVSESTVRKRIARLMQRDGMRISASLGGAPRLTEMLFLIHTEAGRRIDVAERLAALPGVREVSLTTGGYDVVARAGFPSDAEALDFLVQQVEGADGVRSVQASHVLKTITPNGEPGHALAPGLHQPARQAALEAFALEAARAPDIAAVLELGLDSAIESLGADRAAIYMTDPESGNLLLGAARGVSRAYLDEVEKRITPSIGVGIRVVNARVHVSVEDTESSALMAGIRDIVRREGYRSALFLPLLYGEQLVGLINLYTDTPRRYSDDEIALSQAFADQLAIAVARAQSVEATTPKPPPVRPITPAANPMNLLMERLAGHSPAD